MSMFETASWDNDAQGNDVCKDMFKVSKKSKKKKGKDKDAKQALKNALKRESIEQLLNSKTVGNKLTSKKMFQQQNAAKRGNSETSEAQNNTKKKKKKKNKVKKLATEASQGQIADKTTTEESKNKHKKTKHNVGDNTTTTTTEQVKKPNGVIGDKKKKKKKKQLVVGENTTNTIVKQMPNGLITDKKKKKKKKQNVDNQTVDETTNNGSTLDKKKKKKRPTTDTNDSTTPATPEGNTKLKKKKKNKLLLLPEFERKKLEKQKSKLCKLKEQVQSKLSNKSEKRPLSLRERMLAKLKAARFRYLNEQIYTVTGSEAQGIFKQDPDAFQAYHEGYRQQVQKWPVNPVDVIISNIRKLPKTHVIADFGCGEAKLAQSVQQTVHSFDLVAANDSVIACDMSHVPLEEQSVDVAVFCLSLMGTNLQDYLLEANRVLKVGGILKIAEVESRFDNIDNFIEGVERFGFKKTWKDLTHNLFYFIDFKKENTVKNKKKLPTISLQPCLYKKR